MNFQRYTPALLLIGALLITGCASNRTNQTHATQVCKKGNCSNIDSATTASQVITSLHQLLEANADNSAQICTADIKSGECQKEKVCYVVLGGILPGKGCASTFTPRQASSAKSSTPVIDMPLSFIGTSVKCKAAEYTISASADNVISIKFHPYHCSWMVMGQMLANFEFHIDHIDTTDGSLIGLWSHSVKGTGNGSGSGVAKLQFPKNITWPKLNSAQ